MKSNYLMCLMGWVILFVILAYQLNHKPASPTKEIKQAINIIKYENDKK
jgi:hypothetical protein